MRAFAQQSRMEVWYAHLDVEEPPPNTVADSTEAVQGAPGDAGPGPQPGQRPGDAKLTTVVDGHQRIVSDPPTIGPDRGSLQRHPVRRDLRPAATVFGKYRRTLQSDRRRLLEHFELVQAARKIVGVGSVGQRAWVLMLEDDDGEPLFLQAKQAQPSVLADYCGRSRYRNEGERVVAGQHLMQASSDIFLGWTHVAGADGVDRDFYVRQLRDWKFSFPIEPMQPEGMRVYAHLCGWTLARAHARSGDRVSLAAYLGDSDAFDQAIAEFSEAYADQNARDYATFGRPPRPDRSRRSPGRSNCLANPICHRIKETPPITRREAMTTKAKISPPRRAPWAWPRAIGRCSSLTQMSVCTIGTVGP